MLNLFSLVDLSGEALRQNAANQAVQAGQMLAGVALRPVQWAQYPCRKALRQPFVRSSSVVHPLLARSSSVVHP
jgi:hypothetical protein